MGNKIMVYGLNGVCKSTLGQKLSGCPPSPRTNAIGTPQIPSVGAGEGRGGYSSLLLEFISGKSRSGTYYSPDFHVRF